jgi:hypothetical protein
LPAISRLVRRKIFWITVCARRCPSLMVFNPIFARSD